MSSKGETSTLMGGQVVAGGPTQVLEKVGGAIVNTSTSFLFLFFRIIYGIVGVKIQPSNADCPVSVYTVKASTTDLSPVYFRSGAFVLLANDFWLILKQAWTLPLIAFPPAKYGVSGSADVTWLGTVAQIVLIAMSLVITFFSLSTPVFMVLYFPALWLYFYVLRKLDGPDTFPSTPPVAAADKEKFKKEAWLCVNGIATSKGGLQLIIDYLHLTFGRPVTGIYNQTFGMWFDLLECVMQRDLLWPTEDVNIGYKVLVQKIIDPNLTRVVLFAHSQGGIITSIWVDQLLADFPADVENPDSHPLKKLEIYTFASAANHFSSAEAFGRVEHFWNTLDFVSRIGVGHFAPYKGKTTVGKEKSSPVVVEGRFEVSVGQMAAYDSFGKGQSILQNKAVQDNSWLQKYKDGGCPAE